MLMFAPGWLGRAVFHEAELLSPAERFRRSRPVRPA